MHQQQHAKQLEAGLTPPATAMYHDDVPIMAPYDAAVDIQVGKWSTGLCGCCSSCIPNCCMVTCLPCVSLAQVAHRIGVASYSVVMLVFGVLYLVQLIMGVLVLVSIKKYTNERNDYNNGNTRYAYYDGYRTYYSKEPTFSLGAPYYVASLSAILMFIGTWQLRSKVRQRFNIPGGCCEDCFVSYCCNCCALAQLATHVKSYTPGSCDFGPPDVLQAYN